MRERQTATGPKDSARGFADLPFHPFLFAAYAVIALLATNVQEVPLVASLRSLAFTLILAALALAAARIITHDTAKAGLMASVLLIAFFSYGHLYDALRSVTVGGILVGRHRLLASGLLLIVGAVVFTLLRTRRSLRGGTRLLNLVGAAALALALLPIGAFARASIIVGQNPWSGELQAVHLAPPFAAARPDIYYIILDGYARSDYMATEFGFDNSEFMDFLEARGFVVADESRTNYLWTAMSLASSLNMDYVQALRLPLVRGSYPSVFVDPIRHSRVRGALEEIGYSTVSLSSSWTPTELIDADTYLAVDSVETDALSDPASHTVITPFESQLLFTTPLRLVVPRIAEAVPSWVQARSVVYPDNVLREIILAEFDNLGAVAALPGPKFVLAHVVAPHAPYIFTAEGEPIPSEGAFTLIEPVAGAGGGNAARYRDQAIFITRRTEQAIEAILANSPTPPIIVLQSDHGSGAGRAWEGLTKPGLPQRAAILNAYHVPEGCRDSLYPTVTPVNTFRIVFDCVFGESLPLLPDQTYFSPNPRGGVYSFHLIEEPSGTP